MYTYQSDYLIMATLVVFIQYVTFELILYSGWIINEEINLCVSIVVVILVHCTSTMQGHSNSNYCPKGSSHNTLEECPTILMSHTVVCLKNIVGTARIWACVIGLLCGWGLSTGLACSYPAACNCWLWRLESQLEIFMYCPSYFSGAKYSYDSY